MALWRAIDDSHSENFITDIGAIVEAQEYCSAVKNRLDPTFGYPNIDLGHQELRQQIYGNIIRPTEESYEKL
ncbi:hypothetical protein F5B17DRAFT_426736 [Nemania serpens]|nr:hypothetical protein F5B17DRAFT_426736 [Nemania serpens]